MKKVYCLNNISSIGLNELPDTFEIVDQLDDAHAILVRSANMHEMKLPQSVLAIARAGAGVNNIPLDLCAENGIVVFNTPGANANAVKELTIAGMLLASRDIHGGISWIKENQKDKDIAKSVEKAKAKFGGTEISGKTIGIIGLGAIGIKLAQACDALGMKVIGAESNQAALEAHKHLLPQDMKCVKSADDLYADCDFISINVPLLPQTKHMINADALSKMKDHVIVLNFARDALVHDQDMENALASGKVRKYVTDFPNYETANMEGVIAIPHLGASTEEAEDNCASMAVKQIVTYVETGNLVNAVNFSNIDAGECLDVGRLGLFYHVDQLSLDALHQHLNQITTVTQFKTTLKNNHGYAIVDMNDSISEENLKSFKDLSGLIRVRIIK
jgi:D-3-phosphoglycerate dehydrogenase / 2-oxoglutarate reductase